MTKLAFEGNRERLRLAVVGTPGIHLRELQRSLGLSFSTVRHHATKLAANGDVEIHRIGRLACVFPRGFPTRDMGAVVVMRQTSSKLIFEHVFQNGGATNQRIHETTGLAKSTVSSRAASLLSLGILRKSGASGYEIGEGALAILRQQGGKGIRTAVDRYVDLWGF